MSENIFDMYAKEYDDWYDKHKEEFEKEVKCFKKIIDAPKPWLEIGVGSGRFAYSLGIEYGIDPSEEMIKLARKRKIVAFIGRGENLPFPDRFFGAVFIIVTICFVEEPIRVLSESYRVLRNDGKLYLGLIPRDYPLGQLYIKKAKEGHKFYSVAKFYTISEIRKMLTDTGFEVTKVVEAGIEPKDFVCIEAVKKRKKMRNRSKFLAPKAPPV